MCFVCQRRAASSVHHSVNRTGKGHRCAGPHALFIVCTGHIPAKRLNGPLYLQCVNAKYRGRETNSKTRGNRKGTSRIPYMTANSFWGKSSTHYTSFI